MTRLPIPLMDNSFGQFAHGTWLKLPTAARILNEVFGILMFELLTSLHITFTLTTINVMASKTIVKMFSYFPHYQIWTIQIIWKSELVSDQTKIH